MLLGAHVSIGGGIHVALDRAQELGCDALQLFTQNSRTWKATRHPAEDLARFRERHAELGAPPVLCHAIYFINLAAPEPELRERSVETLRLTAEVAREIGALGVVVHVGSHKGAGLEASMERIVEGLRPALDELPDAAWLLLENSAGAGGTIGRDVDELARVIDAAGQERLGLCLDTCHLWVSGVDIARPAVVAELLDRVDRQIGLDRLGALHVNDAAAPLGSNRDRHANLGEGELADALAVMLAQPRLQGLPAVLETAGQDGRGADAGEMASLRRLHALGQEAARRAGAA